MGVVCLRPACSGGVGYFDCRIVNDKRKGEIVMGAVIASILVTVIAVVGYMYFNRQDKVLKDERK